MKLGAIVCGALGERGIIMEKAVEEFSKRYGRKLISFSATVAGSTPRLLSMSGISSANSLAINGCKKRCSDAVLRKEGVLPSKSVCLDEVVGEAKKGCELYDTFEHLEVDEEAVKKFLQLLDKAVEELK